MTASAATEMEMERALSRSLRINGISEQIEMEKYGIGSVRQLIEHTNVGFLRSILSDPAHPLAIKLSRRGVRETRSTFCFEQPIAKTEAYNNSIVPWCIRAIRDGEANLYNPYAHRKAARKRRDLTKRPGDLKPKTECKNCGKHFEASRGIKIHLKRCAKR